MGRLGLLDFVLMLIILTSGTLAVWTGQMAGSRMSPAGAAQTSEFLDELELPRQLPNESVAEADGKQVMLWSLIPHPRNIVTVYAPWCAPCQKELPVIHSEMNGRGNLVVLISQKEDMKKVKEQLENLGLGHIRFYRDVTGRILTKSKVRTLPTTFLTKEHGKVLDRVTGYSDYRLKRIVKRANPEIDGKS